jgi:predicted HAD superfamily hydrolase
MIDQYPLQNAHLAIHLSFQQLREYLSMPTIKVVSFDIFDTLVCRPLFEPDDMFDIMEPEVSKIVGKRVEFKKIRKAADDAVRATLQHGTDVTLDAIYNEIGKVLKISRRLAIRIRDLELSFEKSMLTKRAAVVREMEYACSLGKRVVLTSDMYLSKGQLRNLLHHLGIKAWHDIYVSSEVGLRKDAGTLFPHVLQKEGVKPEEIVHIGDNEHSDIQVAVDMGIKAFHVKKTRDMFLETDLAKAVFIPRLKDLSAYSRTAFSMGVNRLFDDPCSRSGHLLNGDLELFGYFYIGPLLLSYTKWLVEKAEQEKIKHLLFLSRDGEILYKIYQLLKKYDRRKMPKADYIEVSRQALGGPFLKNLDDVHKVLNTSYGGDTLQNFFHIRFGLDISQVKNEVLNRFGYENPESRVYIPDELEKIKALAEYVFQTSQEVLGNKRNSAIKYLKSKKLFKDTKKAIVDIGYSGTMQKYLNDITGKPIHGLYMVTHNSIQGNIGKPGIFTEGLFGNNVNPHEKLLPIDKYSLFYEMILSSVNGPVKEYKVKRFGSPEPIFEEVSFDESSKLGKLPYIHKGILDFCEDFLSKFNNTIDAIPYMDLDFLQEPFRHFHEHPALEDIIMLSGYSIDDYYCGHRILYWVPPIAEILQKNYIPWKFLWRQATDKINNEEIKEINDQLQLHYTRYPDLNLALFDTPLDKEIFDWYQNEFEVLPSWYKKINKIIQLTNGTKRIKIVLEDKDQNGKFNSKAEEIQEWYNKEYERMPKWYKRTGHIIKIVGGQKSVKEYIKKN